MRGVVVDMQETAGQAGGSARPDGVPDRRLRAHLVLKPAEIAYLAATAARAPSLHNSQPWQFRFRRDAIELYADPARNLQQADPLGREMLISCGAALYGLRLAMRNLGYLPKVEVLPDPAQPGLLARVWSCGHESVSLQERELIAAIPHRHTHRGPFAPGRVSARLLAAMCGDAAAEGASLVLLDQPGQVRDLVGLTAAAGQLQQASPQIQAELRMWARPAGSAARDGIPGHAQAPPDPADGPGALRAWRPRPEEPAHERLPQRDFGIPGTLPGGGPLPTATAVLITRADGPADWLKAGQALDRLLLHAATHWVFARLQSQPLESPWTRAEIRSRLCLNGFPQLLLQFGRANIAPATARRPTAEFTATDPAGPPA
jgi:nitroreductase